MKTYTITASIEAAGLDPIDLSNFHLPRVPAMRMTQTVAFKDMPPDAQKAMLEMAGYETDQTPDAAPAISGLGNQQP